MDKLKQKMQSLRDEADAAIARAEAAEHKNKEVETQLTTLEVDHSRLTRKVHLLEDDLDKAEVRVQDLTSRLSITEKASEDSERRHKSISHESGSTIEKLATLQHDLRQTKELLREAEIKSENAGRKLQVVEQDLDRAEERATRAEEKVKALDAELLAATNELRSLNASQSHLHDVDGRAEAQLRDLKQQSKEAELLNEQLTRKVKDLENRNDKLEGEVEQIRIKYKETKEELEATLAELSAI